MRLFFKPSFAIRDAEFGRPSYRGDFLYTRSGMLFDSPRSSLSNPYLKQLYVESPLTVVAFSHVSTRFYSESLRYVCRSILVCQSQENELGQRPLLHEFLATKGVRESVRDIQLAYLDGDSDCLSITLEKILASMPSLANLE